MYRAKALGKARYEVFNTDLRQWAMARLSLENKLRTALERKEFQLHYQAIKSLQLDQVTGFEALLRWRPSGGELVPPTNFIPIAEETGLIIPIGEWVLREACKQLREWQDRFPMDPPFTISVNISGKQFSHPLLVQQIETILQETRLDARSLKLEITESVFIENGDQAGAVAEKLHNLGVQMQIDDFGTGYSSLSYLHRFPINTIKIDRSFVNRMDVKNEKSDLVRTIVMLARDLGMEAIAEGIETEEQFFQLKELECQYGQGYFFSKPVSSQEAEKLLVTRQAKEKAPLIPNNYPHFSP
jgi:EAL domain-containing protein (putative c-di-GMP-specific phosphodiesterase class I)